MKIARRLEWNQLAKIAASSFGLCPNDLRGGIPLGNTGDHFYIIMCHKKNLQIEINRLQSRTNKMLATTS